MHKIEIQVPLKHSIQGVLTQLVKWHLRAKASAV